MIPSLQSLLAAGRQLGRWFGPRPAPATVDDPQAVDAMRRAREAQHAGRLDETRTLYRYVLQRWPHHAEALRGLRDLAIEARDWDEAVAIQQRLLTAAPPADRAVESEWLAVGYYELGRLELARGAAAAATTHFKAALKADRDQNDTPTCSRGCPRLMSKSWLAVMPNACTSTAWLNDCST
jgi:tetratricopeptide (TPR) repeat protein